MRAQLRNQVAVLFLLAPAAVTFTALPSTALAQYAPEVRALEVTRDNGTYPGSRLQLRIDRFDVVPVDRLQPGTELRFTVEGRHSAVATVALPGVPDRVRLRELRPGHYEGSYTLRRSDNVNVSGPIVASLRAGDRIVTANLAGPLVAAVRIAPPGPIVSGDLRDRGRAGYVGPGYAHVPIQILSPPSNARVDASFARVRGRTAPNASVEIGVQAVPGQNGASQKVWEQVVRADDNGNFEFNFVAPSPTPGTRYDVSMTARTAEAATEAHLVLYQR